MGLAIDKQLFEQLVETVYAEHSRKIESRGELSLQNWAHLEPEVQAGFKASVYGILDGFRRGVWADLIAPLPAAVYEVTERLLGKEWSLIVAEGWSLFQDVNLIETVQARKAESADGDEQLQGDLRESEDEAERSVGRRKGRSRA